MVSLHDFPDRGLDVLAARAWARRLYPDLCVVDPVAEGLWAAVGAPTLQRSPALRRLCEQEALLERSIAGYWSQEPHGGILELGGGLSTRLLSLAHRTQRRSRLVAVEAPEVSRARAWLFSSDAVAEQGFEGYRRYVVPAGKFLVLLPSRTEPWVAEYVREIVPRFEAARLVPTPRPTAAALRG
jgi:hypothetical protein